MTKALVALRRRDREIVVRPWLFRICAHPRRGTPHPLPLAAPAPLPLPSHANAAPAPERASAPVTATATSGRAVLSHG